MGQLHPLENILRKTARIVLRNTCIPYSVPQLDGQVLNSRGETRRYRRDLAEKEARGKCKHRVCYRRDAIDRCARQLSKTSIPNTTNSELATWMTRSKHTWDLFSSSAIPFSSRYLSQDSIVLVNALVNLGRSAMSG